MNARPSWDDTWMSTAEGIALRSACDLAQVGAVIIDANQRVVSTGYNGPPRHFSHAVDSHCTQYCPRAQECTRGLSYGLSCVAVHAEANALIFADRRDYAGGTIYVTRACCQDCTKLVANSGLARVVMKITDDDMHRNPYASVAFMRKCGLQVDIVDPSCDITDIVGKD